ncbi:hypothetical protein SRABI106_03097 [Rahnella aquatilis]|nr:hypothetical protein SRABI106_03097 [Rahnella aquatilis]
MRQISRIAATKLQRHRMFCIAKPEIIPFAVNNGAGRDHFGIQQRLAGHQPVKMTAVAIGPVKHRRNGKTLGGKGSGLGHYVLSF